MGLFIFASGYFYKEYSEENVGRYILKKVKRLLVPFFLYNFVYALIAQILSLRGFNFGVGVTIDKLFVQPIINGHQYVYNLSTWFVIPLFMVETVNVILHKFLKKIKHENIRECLYVFIAISTGMLGIWMSSKSYNTGWWLVIARLFHFLPFYAIGFIYKKYLKKYDKLPNSIYFAIILSIQLIIIIYKGGTLYYEQAWSKFSEFNAWPFVVGFLGIAFWLRIAKILEPSIGKSKLVNAIADNTFSIMANQFMGFMLVKAFFAYFYVHTDFLFQDFNWNEYHTSIWYYYFPKNLPQTSLIYAVVAILISILIQKVINIVKNKFDILKYNSKQQKRVATFGLYILFLGAMVLPAKKISDYVEANGGVVIPPANTYTLGKELCFSASDANSDKYCISGFSSHEETITWTDEKEAVMSFQIPENEMKRDYELDIDCGAYGEGQDVDVYVNDTLVDKLYVNEDKTYQINFSLDLVTKNIIVRFEIPNAVSPAELGVSSDTRTLGLSIRKVIIK